MSKCQHWGPCQDYFETTHPDTSQGSEKQSAMAAQLFYVVCFFFKLEPYYLKPKFLQVGKPPFAKTNIPLTSLIFNNTTKLCSLRYKSSQPQKCEYRHRRAYAGGFVSMCLCKSVFLGCYVYLCYSVCVHICACV